jgi:integrase
MTDRNYRRLLQFDDPENVRRLLRIPEQEASRAIRDKCPKRSARSMERALMLALLIHGGLRLRTLRTLKLEYFYMASAGTCQLLIPGHAMKANRPLELVLDSEVYKLWKDYVANHRRHRSRVESEYLFPGLDGGPRSTSAAYQTIRSVLNRAGLEANPHLIRHAIAKICVERDPGAAFAVSRVLGHSSLTTTTSHYLGTESKAAGRHVDKLLAVAKYGGGELD